VKKAEKLRISHRVGGGGSGSTQKVDAERKCAPSWNQIQTLKDCLCCHICCVHRCTHLYRTVTASRAVSNREYRYPQCDRSCVAVCCSVLQCVAVCCSVLQCVAVCCSVLQCVAVCSVCCSALQYDAVQSTIKEGARSFVHCSVLQCVAASCCSVLYCVVVCYRVLQCVALRRPIK